MYVRGHCLLTCETTTIAALEDRYLIKVEQDIWQKNYLAKVEIYLQNSIVNRNAKSISAGEHIQQENF